MKDVELTRRGHTACIVLGRPETLNALNVGFVEEIHKALDEVENDADLYVLVVTGTGKAFIAGADIKEWSALTPPEAVVWSGTMQGIASRFENFKLPVIAAVNGFALGGGCEIVMACDIRIASAKAKLGLPEVSLGVIPGAGGTQRLPRIVGASAAKELLFTGRIITAEEALRIGLVDKITEPDALLEEAFRLAEEICANGHIAVQQVKRAVNQGLKADIAAGLALEAQAFGIVIGTEEKNIGVRAFMEKNRKKPLL